MRASAIRIVGLSLISLFGAGCTHVVTYNVPYYANGPRQVRQPDGTVKAGTGVWIVGEDDSYFHVWTEEAVDGYVNKSAVRPMMDWLNQKRLDEKAAGDSASAGDENRQSSPLFRPAPGKAEEKPKWRLFGQDAEPAPKREAVADPPSE